MRVVRNNDFKRAKTAEQKQLYAAGIPFRFWADDNRSVNYKAYKDEDLALNPKEQAENFNSLLSIDNWSNPYAIIIGSEPTDQDSMLLTIRIAKAMLAKGRRIQMQDMAYNDFDDEDATAYIGYNIGQDLSRDRCQRVRDWLSQNDDRLRILAIAGNPVPLAFEVLRYDFNMILFLTGNKKIIKSFG